MPKRACAVCKDKGAVLKRPKTFEQLCKDCFYEALENEVHHTIISNRLFSPGEVVALGASGGKDSTVLAHIISLLNKRHDYGLKLWLLSIDEGISGYRDDSLETVKRNEKQYELPLKIISYQELYGWTMDEIVRHIGTKNNCTFCGVFRRQALDRGAVLIGANKIATGHNADDMAETVMLNLLRGDLPRYEKDSLASLLCRRCDCAGVADSRSLRLITLVLQQEDNAQQICRLKRCTSAVTGAGSQLPRVKPFKYTYEKEIVMYAYYKKLDYFSTECIYAPYAARGLAREYVKDVELIRPSAIVDIIKSAEEMRYSDEAGDHGPKPGKCSRCGYICSQPVCKACLLLEGLNTGDYKLGISKSRKPDARVKADGSARQIETRAAEDTQHACSGTNCDGIRCS